MKRIFFFLMFIFSIFLVSADIVVEEDTVKTSDSSNKVDVSDEKNDEVVVMDEEVNNNEENSVGLDNNVNDIDIETACMDISSSSFFPAVKSIYVPKQYNTEFDLSGEYKYITISDLRYNGHSGYVPFEKKPIDFVNSDIVYEDGELFYTPMILFLESRNQWILRIYFYGILEPGTNIESSRSRTLLFNDICGKDQFPIYGWKEEETDFIFDDGLDIKSDKNEDLNNQNVDNNENNGRESDEPKCGDLSTNIGDALCAVNHNTEISREIGFEMEMTQLNDEGSCPRTAKCVLDRNNKARWVWEDTILCPDLNQNQCLREPTCKAEYNSGFWTRLLSFFMPNRNTYVGCSYFSGQFDSNCDEESVRTLNKNYNYLFDRDIEDGCGNWWIRNQNFNIEEMKFEEINEILAPAAKGSDCLEYTRNFGEKYGSCDLSSFGVCQNELECKIASTYLYLFDRKPDSNGLEWWYNQLSEGMSQEDVSKEIFNSVKGIEENGDFQKYCFKFDKDSAPFGRKNC